MTSKKLKRLLKKNGWKLVRTRGSHHTYKKDGFDKIITVPHPRKDIPVGTICQILNILEIDE